jgi:hypothetical protein
MELAGLDRPLPHVGRCSNPLEYPELPLAALPELRLLDAGEVTISNGPGAAGTGAGTIVLAPRAFPSISSLASGVVYTSRDRDADALPSGAFYRVRIAGSERVSGLELSGRAPRELSQVTVGGMPLDQVTRVATSQPMDLTWDVGSPADRVYVDVLSVDDPDVALRCNFNDAEGSGSISSELLAIFAEEPVVLALHRRRTVSSAPAVLHGEALRPASRLRFDFELSHVVEFVR